MIRHLLLIKFDPDVSTGAITRVEKAFLHIPETVGGILNVEWGINISAENKNAGFTHCVQMTFLNNAALQHYLPHPEHKKLKAIFRPLIRDIIVLDYKVEV